MTLLSDILKELRGMFLADANLSVAILVLVAVVATCVKEGFVGPLAAGAGLLIGCLAIVGFVAIFESRRR